MKRTNREVASSPEFVALCAEHGVTPTKRQVSKFNLGKGKLSKATKGKGRAR